MGISTGFKKYLMMINVNGSETRYYYHYDGLGSVVALSDLSGNLVESYSYDVFGQTTIKTPDGLTHTNSTVGNRYMFTGREYDNEVFMGLYYYRARYYKPSLGRFLQTDPIHYAGGLNLYTYCGNNPLNWIDPWGLDKEWEEEEEQDEQDEIDDIIEKSQEWNNKYNEGWSPDNQCMDQAGELKNYLGPYNHLTTEIEGRAKRRLFLSGFGFPGNHTVLKITPEKYHPPFVIDPYRDRWDTRLGLNEVRMGTYYDFTEEYPYKQGETIW